MPPKKVPLGEMMNVVFDKIAKNNERWQKQKREAEKKNPKTPFEQQIPLNLEGNRMFNAEFSPVARFPLYGKCGSMFLLRYHVSFPEDIWQNTTDRAALYAHFALIMFEKYCPMQVLQNTHTMFEFLTNDGHVMISELRPYDENTLEVLTEVIKKRGLGLDSFIGLYTVNMYSVDMPAFATPEKAPALLTFIRKCLEMPFAKADFQAIREIIPHRRYLVLIKKYTTFVQLDQCKEPEENACNCERLHLSDYCVTKLLLHKTWNNISMQRWSIQPSHFAIKLYENQPAAGLYIIIAERIGMNFICNEESKDGTKRMVEMEIDGKIYSSSLRNYMTSKKLFTEKSFDSGLDVKKKITVTLYVVNMFAFAADEDAHENLAIFRKAIHENDHSIFNVHAKPEYASLEDSETLENIENEGFQGPSFHPMRKRFLNTGNTLDKSHFKRKTVLFIKAKKEPLMTNKSYKLLSTKTILDTSKSTIFLFLVEVEPQFQRDVLNPALLLANIGLDILKLKRIRSRKTRKLL